METEEKQQFKFMCLDLAIRQTKYDEEGRVRDLTAEEVVNMANSFYDFITKRELN